MLDSGYKTLYERVRGSITRLPVQDCVTYYRSFYTFDVLVGLEVRNGNVP